MAKLGRLSRYKLAIKDYFNERPFFVPENYTWYRDDQNDESEKREYTLTVLQRFFVLLQEPSSCIMAGWVSNFVLLVILVNVVCNVYMTLPAHRQYPVENCAKPACSHDEALCDGTIMCAPTTEPSLVRIDDICVIIFSIEYIARLSTIWLVPKRLASLVSSEWDEEEAFCARHENREILLEPTQTWYGSMYSYFWQPKNLIDFIAIIPFYITLLDLGADASLSFIRVLRLFRIVRAFNMNANAGVTSLIIKTVTESMEVILLLLFFSAMIILIYGSIIFDVEMGEYTVSPDYPDGAYLRRDIDGILSESPFTSTLVGMYWAVITMTTVGYGDIYPVAISGRLLAVTCAFVGVLFMALPISILGANFTVQYQRLSEQQRIERKKRATLLLSKKLELTSGKEINIDLEYEVAKSLVKEDHAKGKIRKMSFNGDPNQGPNAIGGVKTITGNRMADILVGKESEAATAREEYLRKYEMVSHTDHEVELQTLTPRSGDEDSASQSPGRFNVRARASSVTSDASTSDATVAAVKQALSECSSSVEKRQVLKKILRNMRGACTKLARDMEEEMMKSTQRYIEMTNACDALCSSFEEILEPGMEAINEI
jgi:hypothetical protein